MRISFIPILMMLLPAAIFGQQSARTGTGLHEVSKGDFSFDLDPGRNLYAIKKRHTGAHITEVHVLSAASKYKSFTKHSVTALDEVNDKDFEFGLDGNNRLYAIQKRRTGSGMTEVHVLSAASDYKSFTKHSVTALDLVKNDKDFSFIVDIYGNLYVIQKGHTGSGMTEVHVLSAASDYKSFTKHSVTALDLVKNDKDFDFDVDIYGNLYVIQKGHTGSGKTEVHVLSAASNYKAYIEHSVTPFDETDENYYFLVDKGKNVLVIKGANTETKSTEVHILSGAAHYTREGFLDWSNPKLLARVPGIPSSPRSPPKSAGTPQTYHVKDLSLFTAGPGQIGIRNNGSICHIAIMSWSPSGKIEKYRVPPNDQIVIPLIGTRSQLIGEDSCP